MCGIAGWFRRSGWPVPEQAITAQCDRIVHRGPDDSGVFIDGDFGFGMRRLGIIDLAGGHQPIFSPDGRYGIVFNGEIYNHPDLRVELEEAGYHFSTESDTETLLASYLYWGNDAWLRLEGMYGVAIWDKVTRSLTLARDPLGIKPLYITEQNGGIAFGSELRALTVLPEHRFTIDERALHDFFSFGHVQKPRSIYNEVVSLEPGHLLRIGPAGGAAVERFWTPKFDVQHGISEQEWIEETRRQVQTSVHHHMLADVPVGVFLSGGVDSGAVTAAMSRISSRPVLAFTAGFPGASNDETEAASRIAKHFGCEHIVLPLEPVETGDLLPTVQAAFDEPCAATSAVPHWHLARLASEYLKVVLCGDGSDEIFAGYKRQRTALAAARWSRLFKAAGTLRGLLDAIPETMSHRWNYLRQNVRRFRDLSMLDNSYQRFFAATQMSSPAVRARLYDEGYWTRQERADAFAQLDRAYFSCPEMRRLDPLQQFMLADITVHMPASLLNRLDRTSMAHSLEARVPFLSHKFVDWSLTMPNEMKMRGKAGKYALRKAVEPWLPQGALGKRKIGFQLPFAEWFRGDFSTFAREAWYESGASRSGYLKTEAVEALFDEHRAGVANHGRILYAIAMFSCWWQDTMNQGHRAA